MDEDRREMRTLFLGLMGAFLIFGLSYATRYVLPEPQASRWSIGLILASMVFGVGWFVAVKLGFRLGKVPNRGERRAKAHARAEKDKKQRMFR